jgi:integrase
VAGSHQERTHRPLDVEKAAGQALKLSGVRPFVLYAFRHTFATRLGPHVDAWTLCKLMGWSSLSVAMRYIHPSHEQVLQAISALGGAQIWAQRTRTGIAAGSEINGNH